jgi:YD repeat-containing protein
VLGPETDYGYDAALRMTSVTDALSRTTNYVYDALGRQTQGPEKGRKR